MKQVLITISRGIIEEAIFFEDPRLAIRALSDHVKDMNPEHDDAALYDKEGFIANAKHFLDDEDEYMENKALIEDVSENCPKPLFIIGNPEHRLGFMVTSPDDPLGYVNAAEAVSDLGIMRRDFGNHLRLYRVSPVSGPVVQQADLEKQNAESVIEDFDESLVKEYIL
ncbi:MAG: hypothetical protein HN366_02040 [Deltaproteobacteria bacterium]|jgi:hypothetical protein|nr:hypothetical protein [Deltaproteobacteria bacterium]MBT7715358.1 hypothetical protein [Deltaproteobacteria bacterium]